MKTLREYDVFRTVVTVQTVTATSKKAAITATQAFNPNRHVIVVKETTTAKLS